MNGNTIRTFLGANSAAGFASLYQQFPKDYNAYIIKGGPGSGKSSIMKRIATEALKNGFFVEYCYCSSDADSLDAIRVPEMGICVMDGTPPHIVEPEFPGAKDELICTGQFWNSKKLQKNRSEITELSAKIKGCFSGAYRYLSAAGRTAEDLRATASQWVDRERIRRFAREFLRRHTKRGKGEGKALPRFLSAYTPQGKIAHRDTVYTLADSVYVLEDPYRVSPIFLEEIIEQALADGHNLYVCYDPLCPTVPEHVILEEGLAFVTERKIDGFQPQNAYKIHLSRFLSFSKDATASFRKGERLISACEKEALEALKREKAFHDDLEEYYIDAMDFRKLNDYTTKLIKSIFSQKAQ